MRRDHLPLRGFSSRVKRAYTGVVRFPAPPQKSGTANVPSHKDSLQAKAW